MPSGMTLSHPLRPQRSNRGLSTVELPPTPDDAEQTDCQELDVNESDGWPLPHAGINQQPQKTWRENPFISVVQSPNDGVLAIPWVVGGQVVSQQILSVPRTTAPATKPASPFRIFTGGRKRPSSPEEPSLASPPTKVLKQGAPQDSSSDVRQTDLVFGEPHGEVYGDDEYFRCSCGKNFAAKTSLARHLQEQTGAKPYECTACAKQFSRKDVRDRHEKNVCGEGKIACPGCHKLFRKDWLRKHLASPANSECQVFVEAVQLSMFGARAGAKVPDVVDHYWSRNAHAWTPSPEGYVCPVGGSLFNMRPSPREKSGWEPSLRERPIPQRPIQRNSEEPCDLCGKKIGLSEADIVVHYMRHLTDMDVRAFRCDKCQISFAHEKDLSCHLQSARQSHCCGLKFNHSLSDPSCSAHHPPTDSRHAAMKRCLWNWELCQIQAHRATIVRILADRLAYTQAAHTSLNEQQLAYLRPLRWSVASLESFHSAPGNLQFKDFIDIEALAADFASLMVAGQTPATPSHLQRSAASDRPRPDSIAVAPTTFRIEDDEEVLQPPLTTKSKYTPSTLPEAMRSTPIVQMQPNYVDQVRALRNPGAGAGAAETRRNGIRQYAAKANRYFFNLESGRHVPYEVM